jgi:hypothetical protein
MQNGKQSDCRPVRKGVKAWTQLSKNMVRGDDGLAASSIARAASQHSSKAKGEHIRVMPAWPLSACMAWHPGSGSRPVEHT